LQSLLQDKWRNIIVDNVIYVYNQLCCTASDRLWAAAMASGQATRGMSTLATSAQVGDDGGMDRLVDEGEEVS